MRKYMLGLITVIMILLVAPITYAYASEDEAIVFVSEAEEDPDTAESISEILTKYRDSGEDLATLQRVKLMELRSAYEHLTMAEKVHVNGLEVLESAEAALELIYEPEDKLEPDPETAAGMNYVFDVRTDRPKLSLSIRYMTDEDKDGTIDHPALMLISPSGEEIQLRENTAVMSGDNLTLDLTWEDGFVQLDIRSADFGLWQVQASNVCYFSAGDYIGKKEETGFSAEEPEETSAEKAEVNQPTRHRSRPAAVIRALRPLIIITVVGALLIAGIMVLSKLKKSGWKPRRRKEKDQAPVLLDTDDQNDDEEYRRMQVLMEKQQVFVDEGSDDDEDEDAEYEAARNASGKEEEQSAGYIEYGVYVSQIGDEEDETEVVREEEPVSEEKEAGQEEEKPNDEAPKQETPKAPKKKEDPKNKTYVEIQIPAQFGMRTRHH